MKLKHTLIMLLGLWALSTAAQEKRVMVMSNLYVMSPELLKQEGSAFTEASKLAPFMYKESSQIFSTMVDTVRKYRPDLVLIPGDLTKSGELLSHQTVLNTLDAMRQEGAAVLVIPGEQDINNENAVYYNGNSTTSAETVTAEQFAELYKDYGYGENSLRDAQTLSYACEPIEGLVVFGIDLQFCDGAFTPETMAWLKGIADAATEEGKQLVGMIHRNAIEHFKAQSEIASICVVSEWKAAAKELAQHGLRLVFTGHQHVQDVAKFYVNDECTDSLIDVATGTLTMYPNAWRLFSVNEQLTEWSGQTGYVTQVPNVGDVKAKSKAHADANFQNILTHLIASNWEPIAQVLKDNEDNLKRIHLENIQTPEQLSDLAIKYLDGTFRKVLYAHLEGNEPQGPVKSEDIQSEIEDAVWDLLGDQLKWYEIAEKPIINLVIKDMLKDELYPGLNSILEDINQYDTPQASVTDDLAPVITLPRAEKRYDGLQALPADALTTPAFYTLDGRQLQGTPQQKGIYVTAGKKYILR